MSDKSKISVTKSKISVTKKPIIKKENQVSNLARQIYYLKKYGVIDLPPKRQYIKKTSIKKFTKTNSKKIILTFD